MLSRLGRGLKNRQSVSLLVDLLVVAVGVFLAFQVDRWYEAYRERGQERAYLERLKVDLQHELDLFDRAVERSGRRLDAVRLLDAVARDPERAAADPDGFVTALEKAGWLSFPLIGRNVYGELQATGGLALFRSSELLEALVDHYGLLQFQETLGRDRTVLAEFDRRIDGLIDLDRMMALEGEGELAVSPAEAVALARQFQARPAAVGLLPELAQFHLFSRRASEDGARRTQRILELIERLANS